MSDVDGGDSDGEGGNEKDRRSAKKAMVRVILWLATRDSSTRIA